MKSLPAPALVAAVAALVALPFHAAAGATLLLTAWMGFIIHADYALRRRRVALPRRPRAATPPYFRRFTVVKEPHQLAA